MLHESKMWFSTCWQEKLSNSSFSSHFRSQVKSQACSAVAAQDSRLKRSDFSRAPRAHMGVIRITVLFLVVCDCINRSAGLRESCQIVLNGWAEMAPIEARPALSENRRQYPNAREIPCSTTR